jgi:uncharacterized OB-fold protein
MDLMKQSPYGTFLDHVKKGELAYQVSGDGKAVFYPRISAPKTGSTDLQWRVSKGLGTVYATTVVYYKGEPPLNVALIDLDEGFRMLAEVDAEPAAVHVGMRVEVGWEDHDETAVPVFHPVRSLGT